MKLRSFSRTAEALYLTQPTVSAHIKNLEAELGVKLLDRIGKRVIPTEAGETLFRSGQDLLALRDRIQEEIKSLSGSVAGILRIGASTIPGSYVLPVYISMFKKKYPDATLRLDIGDTASVTESVLANDVHIGFVGARPADPHLEAHPLFKDELVLAVAPQHPWARKGSMPVDALTGEPFVLREKGSGTRRIMEERLGKAGLALSGLNVVAVAGNNDAVRQSVKAGIGVSILSIHALRDDLEEGRIAAVRIKGVPLERHFYAVLLKGKSHSLLCREFLNILMRDSKSGKVR